MKALNLNLAILAALLGTLIGCFFAYHHEQNELNRKAYYECLRVTEEIAKSDDRNGVRIVSTPHCNIR
jgi:hypothetical protein